MSKERAKEVAKMFWEQYLGAEITHTDALIKTLESLPEFSGQKWNNYPEKVPCDGQFIYFFHERDGVIAGTFSKNEIYSWRQSGALGYGNISLWQPRCVPLPPVEEESECVKALKALRDTYDPSGTHEPYECGAANALTKAIAAVKKCEAKQ